MTETLAELSGQNTIDGRDLVERLEEIEGEIEDAADADSEDLQELRDEANILKDMIEEINGYSGNGTKYGVTLVSERFWVEHAQEFAEEIGALPKDIDWPGEFIDWDAAADALKQDYTSIDIGGTEYWYR